MSTIGGGSAVRKGISVGKLGNAWKSLKSWFNINMF